MNLFFVFFWLVMVYGYYMHLVNEKARVMTAGKDRARWERLAYIVNAISPWMGLVKFMLVPLYGLIYQQLTGTLLPWYVWAGLLFSGLLVSYYKTLPLVKRLYKAFFVKSSNPHHDTKWLVRIAFNQLHLTFVQEYPTTHTFYRLTARLLFCNTIGHRWTNWENIKYINAGQSRTCKTCRIYNAHYQGGDTFHETHKGYWKQIVNPNSVFRRKYIDNNPVQ